MPLGKSSALSPVLTYLKKTQIEQLKTISAATDAPVSALIRRAVDEYLARQGRRTK